MSDEIQMEMETRSSLKQTKKANSQLMFWNVTVAVLLCLVVVAGIFMFKVTAKDNESYGVYGGSKALMSDVQAEEIDSYHIEQLKKIGVNVNKVDYSSDKDIEKVLQAINESKLEANEKINTAAGFAGFISEFLVKNNQAKISKYVENLKRIVASNELENRYEADFYLLNVVFESSVVESAIPPNEKDNNLQNVDQFAFDLLVIAENLYRDYVKWDSDKNQDRLSNISESSEKFKVPKIVE